MSSKNTTTSAADTEIAIIAKGAGIVFLGTVLGTGLKYLFELLSARYLGVSLFGLFFLGLSVFRIAEILATVGMQGGSLRYGAIFFSKKDWEKAKGTILLSLKVVMASGTITGILLFFLSETISLYIFREPELSSALKIFSIAIPISAVTTIFVFSFQAFKKIKYKVYTKEIIEPLSRIIFIFIVILMGWKLSGTIGAFALSTLAGTLFAWFWMGKVFPQIYERGIRPLYNTREIVNYSWPLYLVGFLDLSLLWISTLLLGYFRTSQEVGLYNAAFRTALLGQMVLLSFNSIFAPIISDLFSRRQNLQLEKLYKLTGKWVFSLSLPLFILMVFFAEEILRLFGEEFVQGTSSLIILCFAQLVNSGTGSSGFMISMTGRSKISLFNSLITLAVSTLLNAILIPRFGTVGAAAATGIGLALINIMRVVEVYVIYKAHPYRKDYFKSVISAVLSVGVLLLANKLVLNDIAGHLRLFLGSLTFLGAYGSIVYNLGIAQEEKDVLAKIVAKIRTI